MGIVPSAEESQNIDEKIERPSTSSVRPIDSGLIGQQLEYCEEQRMKAEDIMDQYFNQVQFSELTDNPLIGTYIKDLITEIINLQNDIEKESKLRSEGKPSNSQENNNDRAQEHKKNLQSIEPLTKTLNSLLKERDELIEKNRTLQQIVKLEI
ncbi:hypothetical protein TVAG_447510 [Trichomonas vaginalis G3]|uniref:Uncharacterized protein n=1 Tax=Trichomonas vaginalis (strain ATCC PRA-98 / G3) TaxID=412133 RepID=A2DS22_TRIV3|nr:hypothetical protein TVAGG3_1001020 [Trichomonas vaginalis G3]EAY16792.1 hypothetical protein TVAG_447510 [Trichomonas vaginalis G3]KAI5490796.1 hypothetical protein TVAGG3_1001020 [Trichomonas vaginalis G3]|eukprot:XP_001329015.1 hypothetical protein [Trichomonas vaginalis G3]